MTRSTLVCATASLAILLHAASGREAVAADADVARAGRERSAQRAAPPDVALWFEPIARGPRNPEGDSGEDAAAEFAARGDGYELYLSGSHAVFAGAGRPLRLTWAGGNPAARAEPREQQTGRVHYFVGKTAAEWRTGVPLFGRVCYRDIYPGIDVEFHGTRARPEFDFVVHPGADPALIRIELEGAGSVEQAEEGALAVIHEGGTLPLRIPRIYQPDAPQRDIPGAFRLLADGSIGFAVGDYDAARALIIDPALTFSTLLGGSFGDAGSDVAVDRDGNIYLAGLTHEFGSVHTPGAVTAPSGAQHVFVAKLNPHATALEYAAVIGGGAQDQARAIAIDDEGNAYLTGTTFSTDFPVTGNALQPSFAGGNTDAFVVKLNPQGSALLYSSYLGGTRQELAGGIAVDAAGNVYLAGSTIAEDFPVLPNALQPVKNSATHEAFLAKMNVDNPAVLASTFFGGTGRNEALDLALAPDGVVVTGLTTSKDFPVTAGVFQPEHRGSTTAFVSKLTSDLDEIVFSTYLGGGTEDRGQTVAADAAGDVYVGGRTLSPDFPVTLGALQGRFKSGSLFGDGFVAKISSDGSELLYSTYLGGSSEDEVTGIAVDGTGQATVVGATGSPDFPLTENALRSTIAGLDDLFVTRLSADGSRAVYSTLLGGEKSDRALTIAAAGPGSVVVAGATSSRDFPPTGGVVQPEVRGAEMGGDALVLRLDALFAPAFSAAGIVNGASMLPGPVAPGELITIFGADLGPADPNFARLTDDGLLSSNLGETRVLLDGVAAPLVFVSAGQISAVVPYAVAGNSSAEVRVEFFGAVSDAVRVALTPASPALFTVNSQGWGPAAALNQDYRLNTAETPANRGSIVILFATGEGLTDQAADGVLAGATLPRPLLPITATVGGRPAEVLYAGGAPGLVAGVMQVNLRIPDDAPTGDGVMVVLDAGEIAGARWVTLAVR